MRGGMYDIETLGIAVGVAVTIGLITGIIIGLKFRAAWVAAKAMTFLRENGPTNQERDAYERELIKEWDALSDEGCKQALRELVTKKVREVKNGKVPVSEQQLRLAIEAVK